MQIPVSPTPFVLGAVAYDPKVVTIWEGFKEWFEAHDLPFEYVLYANYEAQVAAHLRGDIHVAWNSPLAWIQADRAAARAGRKATAIAMRDTDRDLTSVIVTREGADVHQPADLRGRRVAVGALDSPQATLIPLHHLAALTGLMPGRDFEVVRNDVAVGKHGDHVGGERDAARQLAAGEVDAACMIDGNHLAFLRDGTLSAAAHRILSQTDPYDHCNFTVLDDVPAEACARFVALLRSQRYDDPAVRPLLDLEGLHAWHDGRTSGYALLEGAVDRFGTLDAWLAAR